MPPETIANGPLAAKVCVPPVSPLREVSPEPWPMHAPACAKHPANRLMPLAVKVEVAVPVLAKAVRESINPEASMAPAVVVACPTPKPPVRYSFPEMERVCEGVEVPMPMRPKGEEVEEMLKTGVLEVEVAKLKALMARFGSVEVEETL